MAIIKCKMCGGDLTLIEGESVCECEYCGSRQTVPVADDEKKLTLFARANRLRAACEFDKAAGIYEAIVADFPEEAEAYWGLVLCRYGIEYVDDPTTGKKIPTCHRSSFDSIMDDSDFEQVLENADPVARRVYRDEAKQIEEIRKGIIEVSGKEEPYDIFICYKETAENGERTLDSVLAQDIYDTLTDKGYRTFFARITLEDKLGMEYEPYIFAALNSAKIMLAVGTDYEYYNAVWVKNEWSRFLKLMAKNKDKHLIPCYKGIDAYDMPKEFARLQAQDLGKVGAMQDLLRGIEKILPKKESNTTVIQERVVVGGSGNNKIASLLDRGNMALEDGDWAKADSFFEDVLNNDSKNAQAYLGKMLAQEKCRTMDAFVRKRKDATQNVSGQALTLEFNRTRINEAVKKYSLPGYVEQDEIYNLYTYDLGYHSEVAQRKQQYKEEEAYWANHKLLSRAEKFAAGAVAQSLQGEKKALFAALSDRVKKAEEAEAAAVADLKKRYETHLGEAEEKAAQLYEDGVKRREVRYEALLQTAKTSVEVTELTKAAAAFDLLGDYKESESLAEHCRKRAAEEQAKLDAEAERQRKLKEREQRKRRARNRLIAILSTSTVVIALAVFLLVTKVIIPGNKYADAKELLANGQYAQAAEAFADLGNYKDSANLANESLYTYAEQLLASGQFVQAAETFADLGGYLDSTERANASRYAYAEQLLASGQFVQAAETFADLGGYLDSTERANASRYAYAEQLLASRQFVQAAEAFAELGDYKDSTLASRYAYAEQLLEEKKYAQAAEEFSALKSFNNSSELANISRYAYAEQLLAKGKASEAAMAFGAAKDYKDARERSRDLWNAITVQNTISARDQTVGLKSDGTVVVASDNANGECNVSGWNDIVSVFAGCTYTMGLKADGSTISTDKNMSSASNVIKISEFGIDPIYLMIDGTVKTTSYTVPRDIKSWKGIIDISAGMDHIVGTKVDGTVVATGDNKYGQCNVSNWNDIVAISTGYYHTVGLRADGTVVAVGSNEYGQCNVSGWRDIVAISAGPSHTVGLRADGTVVAVGDNYAGQCNVSGWKDIVAISAGTYHTVGLRANGTVVSAGNNSYGQRNVSGWKNIKVSK